MSYEVTATRRRPQKFDDLVGQEFVSETLKNSIKSGKIAHAYLFTGPRGCGKTSTARILAKALNCVNGPTDCPCGKCSNCLEITKGSSLDVLEIDGASNTGVDNIRQIKEEVMFPPSNSRYKIYIVDEVHMLSSSAFNALLKTIEEPPAHVIFIFATTELQKVPATIKSRCQQYNFRLVAIDKVKQCLTEAAQELGIKADDEALFWVARESTGSMRDAYTLFDQVVAFSDGHITYEKIRDKLGLLGVDQLNMLFESCAYGRTDEVLLSLDNFLQNGITIEQFISNCADYLRSILLIKSGVIKESLLGNNSERYSKVVLNAWNHVQVERALSLFLQLYRDIRYSLSPRFELELAFSKLCWIGQYVSVVEVKKAIDAVQPLLGGVSFAQTKVVSQGMTAPQEIASPSNANASSLQGYNQPVQNNVPVQKNEPSKGDSAPVPNGLPRFSVLDNPQALNDSFDNPGGQSGGENQHPFSNGGPLPPEQPVAVLDDRLKLNILKEEVSVEQISVSYEPPANEDFNPDDAEWSNVDEPPEETFFPDEEYAQEYDDNYNEVPLENYESEAAAAESAIQNYKSGKAEDVNKLRGAVTAALSIVDGFAASAIEKTDNWKILSDCVEVEISNEYDKELLEKKKTVIAAEVSKLLGHQISFVVKIAQNENTEKSAQREQYILPVQVQILVDTFKGTIITGKQ